MAVVRVNLALLLLLPQAVAIRDAPSSHYEAPDTDTLALLSYSASLAVVSRASASSAALALPERSAEALLQADSTQADSDSKLRPPNPAAWFGGFAEGESTYDQDGKLAGRSVNTQINVLDGWNPPQDNPMFDQAKASEWFQETRSGGNKQAWQTFYPATQASMAGDRGHIGAWFEGKGGTWQQEYLNQKASDGGVRQETRSRNIPASWFDSSVEQLDGFGRAKTPGASSLRNFLDWEERSVNTTLECTAPGCTANVSLLAPFKSDTEIFKNCRLSVHFRPTDFDDWYSGEFVEWVQVNNKQISSKCRPHADGCNQTAQRPLLPCVDDIPIDLLMPSNGDLKISAKIPESVDECPYQGKMLSAVSMVTCLVAPKGADAISGATNGQKPVSLNMAQNKQNCTSQMPLQCATKGCASEIAVPVAKECAQLGNCKLSVTVSQTDFDNLDGTSELIEYVKVDGVTVKTNLKPGQNPCKSKWKGTALTQTQMNYTALANHPVNVTTGKVLVEGKISKFVDECASNGFLFDAVATVTCGSGTASTVLLETDENLPGEHDSESLELPRRQLRLKQRSA